MQHSRSVSNTLIEQHQSPATFREQEERIMTERSSSMNDVLQRMLDKTDGNCVSLGEILSAFEKRSYGPLLLIVSLIAMLPFIGGVPGMSLLTGTLVIVLAIQLLFLRPHPWLPQRLLAVTFSRDKLTKAIERARPWARWIGKFIGERFAFFTNPPFINAVALLCILLAVLFYPLALIPFAVFIPALAIFFFALGLTTQDGLLILIGLMVSGFTFWFAIYYWPSSWLPIKLY